MPGYGRQSGVEAEARRLVERLGGHWSGGGGLCRCPAHDDRTPSLSIRPGSTRMLLHCFAGCTAAEVLSALGAQRLLGDPEPEAPSFKTGSPGRTRRAAAQRIWEEAQSIPGTPAGTYLAARGLAAASPELRFHAQTPLGMGAHVAFRPALIAAVRDDCGLTGIQRIFLDATGGAAGVKRSLGRLGGGAVRLTQAATVLGIAEGIETALSASHLFGCPCWAVLGAERFAHVTLPAAVLEIHLFLDHDAGGLRAEALARQAYAGIPTRSFRPPRPGDDWNDVLRRG